MIRPAGSRESAPMAVAWPGRMGRASGLVGRTFPGAGKGSLRIKWEGLFCRREKVVFRLNGKEFSVGRKRQSLTLKRASPGRKNRKHIFLAKSLIHRKISVTIKEQMFLVRHVSGYGATELIKRK